MSSTTSEEEPRFAKKSRYSVKDVDKVFFSEEQISPSIPRIFLDDFDESKECESSFRQENETCARLSILNFLSDIRVQYYWDDLSTSACDSTQSD